jgi:hypothetical protein
MTRMTIPDEEIVKNRLFRRRGMHADCRDAGAKQRLARLVEAAKGLMTELLMLAREIAVDRSVRKQASGFRLDRFPDVVDRTHFVG